VPATISPRQNKLEFSGCVFLRPRQTGKLIKTITIRQPWAHAILHLGKDIENRSWYTHYRGPLLIHAAARAEANPRSLLSQHMSRPPSGNDLRNLQTGCILGVVDLVDCMRGSKSRWAIRGNWHWVLENPRPIKPVECTGRLNLWTPPPDVIEKLPKWLTR